MSRWRREIKVNGKVRRLPRGTCQGITAEGWAWYARMQVGNIPVDRQPIYKDGGHLAAGNGTLNWDEAESYAVNLRRSLKRTPAEREAIEAEAGFLLPAVLERVEDDDDHCKKLYIKRIKKHLGEKFDVRTLTRAHLDAYISERVKQLTNRGTKVRRRTACGELRILRTALREANVTLLGLEWPKPGKRQPPVEARRSKPRELSVVQALIAALNQQGDQWIAELIEYVCTTGQRLTEVTRMRKQWLRTDAQGTYVAVPDVATKERRDALVRLTPRALQIVQRALSRSLPRSKPSCKHRRARWPDDDRVWGKFGIDPQLKAASKLAGIEPKVSMRDLRSSHATFMHQEFQSIVMAQHALRHKDVQMTMHYIRLTQEQIKGITDHAAALFPAKIGTDDGT